MFLVKLGFGMKRITSLPFTWCTLMNFIAFLNLMVPILNANSTTFDLLFCQYSPLIIPADVSHPSFMIKTMFYNRLIGSNSTCIVKPFNGLYQNIFALIVA